MNTKEVISEMLSATSWITGWFCYLCVSLPLWICLVNQSYWIRFPMFFAFLIWASYNVQRPGYKLVKNERSFPTDNAA